MPGGLKNVHETCYMNAMIQAVAASNVLIKEYEFISQCYSGKCEKMKMFVDLMKDINASGMTDSDSNSKKLKLLLDAVEWDRASQQDAFQLLSSFINSIQRESQEPLTEMNIAMPPKFKIIHRIGNDSTQGKVQTHLAMALPLLAAFKGGCTVKLESLLDAFFEPSIIEDGPLTMQMNLCDGPPRVLLLHIQANEWDAIQGVYIKPHYNIIYGDTFEYEFDIYCQSPGPHFMKEKVTYKLLSVVHHMGDVSGGHYITYRQSDNQWYLTNDEQIEMVNFDYKVVPYIMVYEKISENCDL